MFNRDVLCGVGTGTTGNGRTASGTDMANSSSLMVVSLRACSLMVKLMDKDIGRGQTAILTLVNSSTANGMATVSDGSWVDTANLKCVPTCAPAGNRHESMNITRACVAKRLADKSTQHSSNRHNIFLLVF